MKFIMKKQTTILLTTTVLSMILATTILSFGQPQQRQVTAEEMSGMHGMSDISNSTDTDTGNTHLTKTSDGIKVDFAAQQTIHASELASIHMQITDEKSGARLSHVDWAIAVKDPDGNVVYKTTTAHSHIGNMDLKVAFPVAGENTVSLTTSSIGKATRVLGVEVEPAGRTHTMISGSPKGFATDPENDFGARTFDFPVYVLPKMQLHTIPGSVPGTSINVALTATSNKIVAGQPTTFVITVTKSKDGSPVTHPDLQVTVRSATYVSSQSAPVEGAMTMHGAIHGHTGVMNVRPTFPTAGRYIMEIELQPSPLSNYMWGHVNTRFDVFVSESAGNTVSAATPVQAPNTVNIIGLEAPFFTPNVLNIKAGTTVTFVNTDGNAHTVTSVKAGSTESDGTFDSGYLTPGKTFTFTFDKPGTYEYICQIHTHMRGTVNVS